VGRGPPAPEELGRPPELLHGGFGLRTVGELRKPRWWALAMLERLGSHRLAVSSSGDGGDSLVETVAASTDSGEVSVLLWNLTLDQSKAAGSPALRRDVAVEVGGLVAGSSYTLRHDRLDEDHSNVASAWARLREPGQAWPTDAQWETLRAVDHLAQLEPDRVVAADESGAVRLDVVLPMPSMSQLTLIPVE
jgi:xylan 1,4-beta-xylosidase